MTCDGFRDDGGQYECKTKERVPLPWVYIWSTFIPEDLRGTVRKARRECQCRSCNHEWESTHPLALDAPEPLAAV